MDAVEALAREAPLDLETIFHAQYERVARVVATVLRDPARAEELAVEVFLRWSKNPDAQGEQAEGWLYRTAVRIGLDELRRQERRRRYEGMLHLFRTAPTPEDIRSSNEDRGRVHAVLATLNARQAGMLVLRSQGFSYDELARALKLNPASVGTLLGRAQQAFRKEFLKRYGQDERSR